MYDKDHKIEFEKYAKSYDLHAIIQKKAAKELIKNIKFTPKKILDIGSGTGEVYKNISWNLDKFVGVDCSDSMCKLHPSAREIKVICEDFNSSAFKKEMRHLSPFDLVISSSSLQWSKSLEENFKFYKSLGGKIAFAIFTDGTFKTIYEMTKRKSFLPNYRHLKNLSKIFGNAKVSKKIYKLDFKDNISKFRYINNSGIGGGNEILNYKKTKYLIKYYPYSYLEFEVTFILN